MSEPIIGSVGVAVVPNAERFWEEFKAKTSAGAENAAPTVRVHADTRDFEARLAELRAQVAASSSTMHVKADTRDAQFQMHLLRDAIIGIGPAAVPVAAVAGGALLGLLPVAATVGLAISGISKQMKASALQGTQFAATVNVMKADLTTLQQTAAGGLMGGLTQALSASQPLFKTVNDQIGVMSAQLGQIVAGAAPALVSIITQLNPLFVTFGQALVHGAQHLEHFATTSTGVSHFVAYVQAELPQVLQIIGNLVGTISHLAQAFAPLGSGVISILSALSAAINAIPIPVLQVLVPVLTAAYAGFRTLSAVTAIVKTVSGALEGFGSSAEVSALRATVASKQYELAVATEAAAVARAKASEAAEVAAASAAIAASLEGTTSVFAAEAAAAALSSAEFAAAMETEAAAAAASALTISASAEAAAAALDTAGAEAAVGWAGLLGPLAAVGVGVGLLVAAFGHSNQAAMEAKQAADSYAQSVKESTDALNAANIAQTNDNLAKSGALRLLDELHSKNLALSATYGSLTQAVNGSNEQFQSVAKTLSEIAVADPFSKTGHAAFSALGDIAKYRGGLKDQIQTQKDLNVAMEQSQGITDQAATAAARLYGLTGTDGVNAYLTATEAAKKSTDQAKAQTLQWQLEGDAANLLKQAIDNLSGKQLDSAQALNTFQQSLVSIQQGAAGSANAVTGLSQVAIQNRGNLISAAQAAIQAADAYGQQTGSTEAGRKKLIDFRNQLINNAVAAGENRKQVTAFIDSILKIPARVPPTKLEVDKAKAETDLANFKASLAGVHGKVVSITATIDDAGLSTFAATVERLSNTAGVTVSYGNRGVTHQQKADGGYISGPGTGTSDSIPAMLSNGEFVVNAAQTSKHIDLLNAINKGVQGFAGGGVVGLTDIVTLTPKKASTKAAAVKTDSLSITAGAGAAYAIAEVIRGNIPEVRKATADLSKAVNEAFQLKGVQSKLATVQAQLKQLQQDSASLRASVQTSLGGSVDVSKYADVGGLLDALGNQTGVNSQFTGELNKLSKEGVDKNLLQRLASAGPSAGLDTLAGASMSQIKQVNAAFGSYINSANAGGTFAATDVYGSRIAADQKLVTSLGAQAKHLENNIDKLVSVVAKMTGRPVEIKLDGKVLASAVFKSKEFDGVLDGISHALVYR